MRNSESLFCERCGFVRHFTKRMVDHKFYLGATLFTFGLWGVPWLVLAIDEARRPWRCSICGSRHASPMDKRRGGAAPVRKRENRLLGARA